MLPPDVTVKGNYVFTAIFVIEAIIKMLGHGWPVYWRNHWNKFDFFIVLASIFDLVISLLARSFSEVFSALKIQKLLQILRLSRMLKLVKSLKVRIKQQAKGCTKADVHSCRSLGIALSQAMLC